MDQKNLLIAIALSFLVFLGWSVLFGPKTDVKQEQAEQTQESAANATESAVTQEQEAPAQTEAAPLVEKEQQAVTSDSPPKTLTVDTPLYTMVLTEQGAAITSMAVKKYRETIDPESPPKQVISEKLPGGTVLLSSSGSSAKTLETARFSLDRETDRLVVESEPSTIHFKTVLANGLQVDKSFTFSADTYLVQQNVTLFNGGDKPFNEDIAFVLQQISNGKAARYGFEGPSGLVNDKHQQIKAKSIGEGGPIDGKIKWVALETHYFMSSLVENDPQDGQMITEKKDDLIRNKLVIKNGALGPNERKSTSVDIYIGPKGLAELKKMNNGLDRAIEFGWFDFIAKPCLWFMNFIYGIIPNYGVAIIILTIITRMAFWPLATKSYKSMSEMRKIQPLMQEVREKYKDDKAKMNQEMMALYRTYKINPMGGCLPMLIQLPVFFALYRMLYQVIELRHAPFIWWINDLSAPDRLFHFSFKIPFMEAPYGIPVLTLIMGATMLLQQKMTPSPGDPTQAKMMMLMPVVFTVIFINFSSGLVLYWLVSNLLSIAQQYYTQKKLA